MSQAHLRLSNPTIPTLALPIPSSNHFSSPPASPSSINNLFGSSPGPSSPPLNYNSFSSKQPPGYIPLSGYQHDHSPLPSHSTPTGSSGLGVSWILFIIGWFCGITWFIGMFFSCFARSPSERLGGLASLTMVITGGVLIFIIFTALKFQ